MTIGAFLDAGLDFKTLTRELKKLKLKGYVLSAKKVTRGGIACTKFDCIVARADHSHCSLTDINSLIGRSALKKTVKDTAKNIFARIAEAETRIHGKSLAKDVIFHELGDTDSIIDIVGTAIAIDELGIEAVYSSNITMGRTVIRSRHGVLPIPSPASLELLKGFPISITEIDSELVTPTGAGILSALSKSTDLPLSQIQITGIGYGAGSKEFYERPNTLRVLIGEMKSSYRCDSVYVIETNIDDMNPQGFEYLFERLFKEGALDVYATHVQMKKTRPGFLLTVLAKKDDIVKLSSIIFSETTTIGLRFYEAGRFKLDRKAVNVRTRYGDVNVKVSGMPQGARTASPEYENCVKLAREKKIPLKTIYDEAKRLAFLFIGFTLYTLCFTLFSHADTIYKNDGSETKGIVVEDYNDRIVFSTANGEKMIMKSDIKELYYDDEEENLIKLAEQAKEKQDYTKALTYYEMAFKANPNLKAAKDGLVFLQGYLFRKEEAQKEDDVKKRDDIERQGAGAAIEPVVSDEISEKSARLKKTLGITLGMKGNFPVIENVQPHSAAYDAGLEKGDKLTAIWSRLTGYMELTEVMNALLDKPSLELKCTFERAVKVPNGLGASFTMEFDGLTIASIHEGGPAQQSGLRKGDLITEIDGKSARYMPLKNAVNAIEHAKGDAVNLTIRREVLIWRRD